MGNNDAGGEEWMTLWWRLRRGCHYSDKDVNNAGFLLAASMNITQQSINDGVGDGDDSIVKR